MPEETTSDEWERLNLRLTKEEMTRFKNVQKAIQRRVGPNIRATQKAVFLESLTMIEAYYEKLEKDRQRNR